MFENGRFWCAVLALAAVNLVVPSAHWRTRALAALAVSFVVLYAVVGLTPVGLLMVVGAAVWVGLGVWWMRRGVARRLQPGVVVLLLIVPLLAFWVLGKEAAAFGWQRTGILYVTGWSYFIVKAWTLIKDVHDERVRNPDPVIAVSFFLFFPTYVAGPMHLYSEFDRSLREGHAPDGETIVDAAFRFVLGLVKVRVLAPLLAPLSLAGMNDMPGVGPGAIIAGSLVYSVVLWADFSGYTDLAISTSRLVGINAPENFQRPFLATNIREFWQRWHISFTRVLTSYVFVPISRRLQRTNRWTRTQVVIAAYGMTFLLVGFWHGPTANFALWGMYHGAGLVAYDVYHQYRAGWSQRFRVGARLPGASVLGRALSMGGTFMFVSLGWILFVRGV